MDLLKMELKIIRELFGIPGKKNCPFIFQGRFALKVQTNMVLLSQ